MSDQPNRLERFVFQGSLYLGGYWMGTNAWTEYPVVSAAIGFSIGWWIWEATAIWFRRRAEKQKQVMYVP